VVLIRENFGFLGRAMDAAGVDRADVILADLGVRSAQLNDASRGFSFQADGPLDMRLDDRLTTTAADLVNGLREQALADVIYFNADERHSRRIAKRICEVRRERRIATTGMLSEVVCGALGADPASRKQKIHPATRVFQALRIAVNDELGALDRLLAEAPERLSAGGRFGVMSFHSLEDGRVKRDFRCRQADGIYEVLTKRPVVAEEMERASNPRSRSAKFRAAKRMG
jgi:16S rRNA (cytosine1402-N4)-methyltransferase